MRVYVVLILFHARLFFNCPLLSVGQGNCTDGVKCVEPEISSRGMLRLRCCGQEWGLMMNFSLC